MIIYIQILIFWAIRGNLIIIASHFHEDKDSTYNDNHPNNNYDYQP